MAKTNFWFATFKIENVTRDLTDLDRTKSREDIIRESLQEYVRTNEAVTESSTGKWYFGAIDDRGDTILGQFGKEYTDETSQYDEERGRFVDEAGASIDAQYSMFILHFPTQLIIYNTRNRVGYKQFLRNFTKGYNEKHGGQMRTEPLRNTADVDTVISEHRVFDAEFELEPSNPSSEPEWEALDDSIHEMVADRLGIEVEAIEGSDLNFDEELLSQILEMSKTEYGEFEIYYDEDGYVKKITSGEGEPIVQRETEPEGLGGLAELSSQLINYASTFID